MFSTDYKLLQRKLNILLDYKVPVLDILKSFYVFDYSVGKFIARLERMKAVGINVDQLWLINCTDEQFER